MQTKVTIIWEGNLWNYTKKQLSKYEPESFSAKYFYLKEDYKNQINEALLNNVLDRLKTWEKILFTWRQWLLFDKLIEKITLEYKEFQDNFIISWVNWIEDYWDLSRLSLNAKVTKDWIEEFDTSCLYTKNKDKELIEMFRKLYNNIEITSNKDEFLKYFFNKALLNIIVNSASILFFNNIIISFNVIIKMYQMNFPDKEEDFFLNNIIKEFNIYIKNIYNFELSKEEFIEYLNRTINKIWEAYPSSFYQHWWIIDKKWKEEMDFNLNAKKFNSDIEFIFERILNERINSPLIRWLYELLKETKKIPKNQILNMFNDYLINKKK